MKFDSISLFDEEGYMMLHDLELVLLDASNADQLGLEDCSVLAHVLTEVNQCHIPRTLLAGIGPMPLLP